MRIFAGKPQAGRSAKRQAADMRPINADRLHEGGDVVGEQFHRIGARRLVGFAGAARIDRDAGEVLGVVGDLEGVAGIVGGQIRDEHEAARPFPVARS